MKIAFLSDIHGIASTLSAALAVVDVMGYDRLVLLGDLLYHGPRNGVPAYYEPEKVVEILNARKDKIVAVRGNCDAEVDQSLLEFPMMADYTVLDSGRGRLFLTHGHLYNERRLPPLGVADVLVQGHTHIPELRNLTPDFRLFNPGSVSLPKRGSTYSFGYFDGVDLRHCIIPSRLIPVELFLGKR